MSPPSDSLCSILTPGRKCESIIMAAPFILYPEPFVSEHCLCLSAFLSDFCKLQTALSRFCSAFQSNHPPDIPQQLLWLCLVPHQRAQTVWAHSTRTAPLSPHSSPSWHNHCTQEQPQGLLSVTPPQPPSSYQLYCLALPQMAKVGLGKGLGPRPLIILSYLQYGFKINPASPHSAISVNWTVLPGKWIGDF